MPSSSKKQHNFMAAIANNPAFAKKVGIPQSVGKDYTTADKGKTFKRGDDMAAKKMNMGGMMKKGYASGGAMPMVMKDGKKVPSFAADGEGKMAKGGMHKMPDGKMMKNSAMKKMAEGGGIKDDEYRANKQAEIAARQAAVDATNKAKADTKAKAVYDQFVKQYEREKKYNPDGMNKRLDKGFDNTGDAVRSVGRFFGTNRMTSQDDVAQMQARKDVKGYAKGGKVSSASSRADGCAVKGKTRGKFI